MGESYASSAVNYADVFIASQKTPGVFNVTHPTDASDSGLETPTPGRNTKSAVEDLPLSCPMPEQKLWNSHPRVYLPIEETGIAVLPLLQRHLSLG